MLKNQTGKQLSALEHGRKPAMQRLSPAPKARRGYMRCILHLDNCKRRKRTETLKGVDESFKQEMRKEEIISVQEMETSKEEWS
jgi:hypothetical protein